MFNERHYKEIGEILRQRLQFARARVKIGLNHPDSIYEILNLIADFSYFFKKDDKNFDYGKFYKLTEYNKGKE